jgi:hypothetical protein
MTATTFSASSSRLWSGRGAHRLGGLPGQREAHVPLQTTATRLWKRLTAEERLQAATEFWQEPSAEMGAGALGAIVRARRMRPQAARALASEQKARSLAQLLDPGETVAASLIVALHLAARRPMLSAFLDLLGLPHEDGILKDEAAQIPPPGEEQARNAVRELVKRFPVGQVETYMNALWLQDPDHWGALAACGEWLSTEAVAPAQGPSGS